MNSVYGFRFLWEKIENKRYTISGLISGVLILLLVFISVDSFLNKYIQLDYLKWIYFFTVLLWISYWFLNRFYIPKNDKNKVGIVLCIYADSDEAEKNLKRDFIDTFYKQIINEKLGSVFCIRTIKNHLAKKFNNFDSIKKLHKKVNGHIYIFGEIKKRQNGSNQYFLFLDGMVMHRPVAQNTSQELAKDFLATLPKRVNFNDEFAFKGFQVSADIVLKSVKYIVGLAAFVSGDYELAIQLHTSFEEQMKQTAIKLPYHDQILSKLKLIIANEYALLALYFFTKDQKEQTYENLKKAFKYNDKCYQVLVLQTIIAFGWEKDAKKALKLARECHNFNFPEWRYNETFLYFWLKNYPTAWKQCEKIKKQNFPNEIITSQEVTQFNEKILESNDSNPSLYFWVGFNYYYKQNNLPMALKNFELFEEKADSSMNILKQKSSSWLIEIKQTLDKK